ncbi:MULTISPECIES: helix-turn-helix transcriptional regulator [unclassified Rhizobium]|uniref:helix-turn-helix domain-containing protein n=1 Tax=unclassified Rhizobium TaxID=2613769 RepID=UPI0006FA6B01|nr:MULTISPECIES: helix-turn-helix transcriptional regulator [unclassified Rhizobium]KQV38252.1 XRE family transcriptional regulator [Rhizobium sp. Root1212]KRD30908.1 XRE family transcriptional regulator [Rhizobium sp. Root268]
MNRVSEFITPGGEQMVVLPRADYESLVEMAEMLADVAAYDNAKQRIADGDDVGMPIDFVDRLIDGESPLRVWRDFRGLSGRELASRIGISAAYLSEIETGKKEGSLSVLKAIAVVLDVDLDDLVWGEERPTTGSKV